MSGGQIQNFNMYRDTHKVFQLTRRTFQRKGGQGERTFQNNWTNNDYAVKLNEIEKVKGREGKTAKSNEESNRKKRRQQRQQQQRQREKNFN